MEVFPYLSVLVSIILGLAITQVLQGVRAVLVNRARVRFYWPVGLWVITILMIASQMWWGLFDYYDRSDWTYAKYSALLLQTTFFYLASGMVMPDVGAEGADLKLTFFANARWFFALLCATAAASLVKDIIINGALPQMLNVAFHAGFFTVAALGAFIRSPRFHEILAPAAVLGFGAYIVLLFAQIG